MRPVHAVLVRNLLHEYMAPRPQIEGGRIVARRDQKTEVCRFAVKTGGNSFEGVVCVSRLPWAIAKAFEQADLRSFVVGTNEEKDQEVEEGVHVGDSLLSPFPLFSLLCFLCFVLLLGFLCFLLLRLPCLSLGFLLLGSWFTRLVKGVENSWPVVLTFPERTKH